jgi:hypothetical protein
MRPTLSLHSFAQHIFNRIDDKDFIDPVFCQTVDTLAPYSWQPQGPLSHNQYGPISQGMRPSSPTTPEYVHAFVPGENCRSPPNSGTPAPTCMPNSAEFVPAFDSHTPSRPTPPWTYAATHGTPNTTHIRPASHPKTTSIQNPPRCAGSSTPAHLTGDPVPDPDRRQCDITAWSNPSTWCAHSHLSGCATSSRRSTHCQRPGSAPGTAIQPRPAACKSH